MALVKIISRITGAVLGGYGLTALLIALFAALLVRAGMARSEAVVGASIAGFLIYLMLLVWALGAVRLRSLWTGLALGSGSAYGLLLLAR